MAALDSAVETVQPAATKATPFTRIRWSFLTAGLVLGLASFCLFPDSLSIEGRGVGGIGVVMAFWWMTEAVPIEVTSLLPLILFPVTGIASIGEAAAPYANSVIYLVLGGIVLGLATQRWNLHRRVALLIILAVGTKPSQIVFGLHAGQRVHHHVGQQYRDGRDHGPDRGRHSWPDQLIGKLQGHPEARRLDAAGHRLFGDDRLDGNADWAAPDGADEGISWRELRRRNRLR